MTNTSAPPLSRLFCFELPAQPRFENRKKSIEQKFNIALISIACCIGFASCKEAEKYEIHNGTQKSIKISYDDRIYRSDLESKTPNIVDTLIQPGETFFVGIVVGNPVDCSYVWPATLSIKFESESIALVGRTAICSMFDENGILNIKAAR